MGLFTGMSYLSFIEIAYFMAKVVMRVLNGSRDIKNRKDLK